MNRSKEEIPANEKYHQYCIEAQARLRETERILEIAPRHQICDATLEQLTYQFSVRNRMIPKFYGATESTIQPKPADRRFIVLAKAWLTVGPLGL